MRLHRLDGMVKGWFVGDFEPVACRSREAEVAVKRYAAGDDEAWHYHEVATEVTVIVEGTAEMCGRRVGHGDIVVLDPGDGTAFRALTDVVTAVVKLPSVPG